jgi:hypothetical protein
VTGGTRAAVGDVLDKVGVGGLTGGPGGRGKHGGDLGEIAREVICVGIDSNGLHSKKQEGRGR